MIPLCSQIMTITSRTCYTPGLPRRIDCIPLQKRTLGCDLRRWCRDMFSRIVRHCRGHDPPCVSTSSGPRQLQDHDLCTHSKVPALAFLSSHDVLISSAPAWSSALLQPSAVSK